MIIFALVVEIILLILNVSVFMKPPLYTTPTRVKLAVMLLIWSIGCICLGVAYDAS